MEEVCIRRYSVTILFRSCNWAERWRFMAVYGPARASERSGLWAELNEIQEQWQGPWIVEGDFNTIRFPLEKNRPTTITTRMRNFSNFIQNVHIIDLPLEGAKYTWTNKQENLVMSRLDRVLISREWYETFPLIYQRELPRPTTDHNPILFEAAET
ncbi:uncharacterized protein LOC143850662 [Tasmannia lanceolata]|uniref:uncharacterized protein LOC143850662 n=1 Tax=Tasmannia lanceolata TaxID=3420 RepID=UPI0040646DEE